jgi:protein-tyrosine phosphatase
MKVIMKIGFYVIFAAIVFSSTSCKTEKKEPKEDYLGYENHVALKGEDNMRDLGGFVGEGGKLVLYRKLFCSGELSHLTDADLDTIISLGIEQLVDLRFDSERVESPDRVPQSIAQYHLPLIADIGGKAGNREELLSKIIQGEMTAQELMLPVYSTIDSLKEANWKKIFDLLEANKTTLWHCTEGKDRAGMTTALVLFSLGVDRDTVIKDYMASNTYLAEYIEQRVAYMNSTYEEGVGEMLRPVLGVKEDYILAFLNAIDDNYGSMDTFLINIDVDIAKMQANYLEK